MVSMTYLYARLIFEMTGSRNRIANYGASVYLHEVTCHGGEQHVHGLPIDVEREFVDGVEAGPAEAFVGGKLFCCHRC